MRTRPRATAAHGRFAHERRAAVTGYRNRPGERGSIVPAPRTPEGRIISHPLGAQAGDGSMDLGEPGRKARGC